MIFVCKDERGNYVSQGSFQRGIYVFTTGKCNAVRVYQSRNLAQEVMDMLTDKIQKLGLHKQIHIEEVNEYDIKDNGEILKEPYNC